jgi:signal transduction histidine kinase
MYSNINYTITAILATAYYFFARYFNSEQIVISRRFKTLTVIALIIVIFFVQIPIPDWAVVKHLDNIRGEKVETFGYGYIAYILFILYYFIAGLVILSKKFLKTRKDPKLYATVGSQLRYIILGTSFSILLGITTNVIFPNLHVVGHYWLGPVGTLVMVLLISFAISRHKLWDFRLIAVELFIALLNLTILLQVLAAETSAERVIKITIFTVVVLFSYYVIKNLLEEVHARERLEQLAEDLAHANKRLQMIDQEKSDFVSITSHQFRTPLTVIGGYTSMLLEGSFEPLKNKQQREVLDKMFQASKRLVFTIEEFLNISRLERNEMRYRFEKTDVKVLLASTISVFEDIIKQASISFSFHVEDAESYLIYADLEKTKTVIGNILDNAVKYTPRGGSITVVLSKDEHAGKIILTVTDTGIGIPPEMRHRLFEKFSRAPGVSKLHTEGRGLGLYIAQQIMKAQRGDIHVSSEGSGKGSVFTLHFPAYEFIEKQKEIKSFVEDL